MSEKERTLQAEDFIEVQGLVHAAFLGFLDLRSSANKFHEVV